MIELRERTDKKAISSLPNVPLLSSLSKPLWAELVTALYAAPLLAHDFLRALSYLDKTIIPESTPSLVTYPSHGPSMGP